MGLQLIGLPDGAYLVVERDLYDAISEDDTSADDPNPAVGMESPYDTDNIIAVPLNGVDSANNNFLMKCSLISATCQSPYTIRLP